MFVVGVQINGVPHLGTPLVQTSAFLLAQQAREVFGAAVQVRVHVLDQAVHERVHHDGLGCVFQRSCFHALGGAGIAERVAAHYGLLFAALSRTTGIGYTTETYSLLQSRPRFRTEFLHTLDVMDSLRWWLAPSSGTVPVWLPCPSCGWAEEGGTHTRLGRRSASLAVFEAACRHHGRYEAPVDASGGNYLHLSDLHRNLVKERVARHDTGTLQVMIKGVDWAPASSFVDRAHTVLGTPAGVIPARVFTPLVLFDTGAQLSKSLIRSSGGHQAFPGTAPWMLAATHWPGTTEQYAHMLLHLTSRLLADLIDEPNPHRSSGRPPASPPAGQRPPGPADGNGRPRRI